MNLIRLAGRLADFIYPPKCTGCDAITVGTGNRYWCPGCLDGLPWIRSPLCPRCGRPFPAHSPTPDHLCGDCLVGGAHFDAARSAVFYGDGPVTRAILELKFGGKLHCAPPLADLLHRLVGTWEEARRADWIVPVPLHPRRLRSRGYNQAALLSKFLGSRAGIPVAYELLTRARETRPQTRLSREQRLANVRGAFLVADAEAVSGRRIRLVDDVFTTGTTLDECALALKRAGAARIAALTVARSVPGFHL